MSGADQLWFRHPEKCWSIGDIKQMHGKEVELREVSVPGNGRIVPHPSGAVFRVPLSDTHACDVSHLGDSEDIAAMNNMHEGPLLALLERRYAVDKIYTFTGDILISINPYKQIAPLYVIPGPEFPLPEYKESKVPHVFAMADAAYRSMLEETHPMKKNQSMIVSGESGAGKTEACKHVMRFLASLSQRHVERQTLVSAKSGSGDAVQQLQTASIEKKVLDCNPFLEAFGNAKTLRNDNSSRFGKFTKIEYDGGRIIGARIRHYLLEKARVVSPQQGERNYHIFYQVVRGLSEAERAELRLTTPEDFEYLSNGGVAVTTVDGVDDVEEFRDVQAGLITVGIEPSVQSDMWRIVAGLLHLGNVTFGEKAGPGGAPEAFLLQPESAALAGKFMGAPLLPTKLVRRLMKVKGRSSAYEVNLSEKQAAVARDSLAKTVYERLFTWLIDKCNRILSSKNYSSGFIGILDIFGFEIFQTNSFEQLCINYANEKLQNLFNHHIFVMEQAQYAADGVDVATIEFINNQPCVDLIEKKPSGLLPLLDEICFLGRETTDAAYLDKIDRAHKGVNKFFGNPKKRSSDRFSVMHFAGEVTYCVEGFIDKNNDTLYTDLEELMMTSSFELTRGIFDDAAMGDAHSESPSQPSTPGGVGFGASNASADDGGHASPGVKAAAKTASKGKTQSVSTIASKFKTQLGALNDTLLATSPHYVRCVKPNKIKKPVTFDHEMILTQLLYSGVLETVRIRRQGFPFRETFLEFWRRACRVGFTCLVPVSETLSRPPLARYETAHDGKLVDRAASTEAVSHAHFACKMLLNALVPKGLWTNGRTKVFLKDGAYDSIIRAFRAHHTKRMQSWWRMAVVLKQYNRFRHALAFLKKQYKSILLRRRFAKVAGQVTALQAHIRRRRVQKRYARMKAVRRNAGAIVYATVRMWRVRIGFKKLLAAWERMQSRMKVKRAQNELAKRRKAVRMLQRAARAFLAVSRFRRAKRLRLHGASMIQSAWRGHAQRVRFLRIRAAVRVIQKAERAWKAHRLRMKTFRIIIFVQATYKRWKARLAFRRARLCAVALQSWWRSRLQRRKFVKIKNAVLRIERATFAHVTGRSLVHWLRALHAACAWGDPVEIDSILLCHLPEHSRVRHIPIQARLAVRNRSDGFKTAMHAAAVSGSVAALRLLVGRGANPWLHDSLHATPLHKAAAIGDTAAEAVAYLISLAGGPPHAANAANAINLAGETVLDTAVQAARSTCRRGHDAVVRAIMEAGGVPRVCGATTAAIQAALARPKPTVDPVTAATEAAAAREAESFERRGRERRADPYYQLLWVAEGEREKARAREAEAARVAAEAEAVRGAAAARHAQAVEEAGRYTDSLLRARSIAAGAYAVAHAGSAAHGARAQLQQQGDGDSAPDQPPMAALSLSAQLASVIASPAKSSDDGTGGGGAGRKSLADQYADLQAQARAPASGAGALAKRATSGSAELISRGPPPPASFGAGVSSATGFSSKIDAIISAAARNVAKTVTPLAAHAVAAPAPTPTPTRAAWAKASPPQPPSVSGASKPGLGPNRSPTPPHPGTVAVPRTCAEGEGMSALAPPPKLALQGGAPVLSRPPVVGGTAAVRTGREDVSPSPFSQSTLGGPFPVAAVGEEPVSTGTSNAQLVRRSAAAALPRTGSVGSLPLPDPAPLTLGRPHPYGDPSHVSPPKVSMSPSHVNITGSRGLAAVRARAMANAAASASSTAQAVVGATVAAVASGAGTARSGSATARPARAGSVGKAAVPYSAQGRVRSSSSGTGADCAGAGVPASPVAPLVAPLPVPVWRVHTSSSTGLLYYYNRTSGVSQWSEPGDWDGVYEAGQLEALRRGAAIAAKAAAAPAEVAVHPHPAPQGLPAMLGTQAYAHAAVYAPSAGPGYGSGVGHRYGSDPIQAYQGAALSYLQVQQSSGRRGPPQLST